MMYQCEAQINGTAIHKTVDEGFYSTASHILQGISVYSEKYNLIGKIDVFDAKSGVLRERKKKIKNIFDGYVFQMYSQYFALTEMGYEVKKMILYSYDDNVSYPISIPKENDEMLLKFESVIEKIKSFSLNGFYQENLEKCLNCIYEPLCSFSRCKKLL